MPASADQPSARAPERLAGPAAFTAALLRDYSGYFLSLGMLTLGNLLLLPLITAYLSPSELGLYSLLEAAQVQAGTLAMLGMKFAYLYYYAQHPPEQRPVLLGNALLLTITASLLIGLLLVLLFSSASVMAWFDAAPLPMAWLLLPPPLFGAVQSMLLTELRASRHIWLTGAIAIAQLVLLLLLSTWLVAGLDYGLPGLLIAQAVSLGLSSLFALSMVGRRLSLKIRGEEMARLLRYGVPLMLGLMLRYSLDTLCRFLLAAMVSIEAAGLFLVVNRVTLLFEGLLALPFFMAWGGLVHHALRRPEAAQIVARVTGLALAAAALLAIAALIAQPLLFRLLAHDAMPQMAGLYALLLLSRVILTVKSPLTSGILRTGRTGWSVSNNLLALGVFLAAVWPAARLAGLEGVAGAMLLANLASTITLTVAAWQHCPQRLATPALALGVLLTGACTAMILWGPLPAWLIAGLVLVAAPPAIYMARHATVTDPL